MAGTRTVVAPDGRVWKVGRQWLSGRVRLRRERERDVPDGFGATSARGVFAAGDAAGAGSLAATGLHRSLVFPEDR